MQKDNLKNITPADANNVLVAGLSTLKAHYIIGNKTGCCQPETIHFQRKGAIAKFIEGSNMTWEDCVKSGWQVYKVDVVFQPCHQRFGYCRRQGIKRQMFQPCTNAQ